MASVFDPFVPSVVPCIISSKQAAVKAFGNGLQDAPYLLEPLAASFANEDVAVRLALLSAVCKLFFQRPPECQRLLGTVLAAAAADSNIDVHDRALLYYRCVLTQTVVSEFFHHRDICHLQMDML